MNFQGQNSCWQLKENKIESCLKYLPEKLVNDTKKASCVDVIKKNPDLVC